VVPGCRNPNPDIAGILDQIDRGEFSDAEREVRFLLADRSDRLTPIRRMYWEFEIERMHRIRQDFTKSEDDVLAYIRKYYPDADGVDLRRWEDSRALEVMVIDGERRYFHSAARNLFRVDPGARAVWREKHAGEPGETGLASEAGLDEHLRHILREVQATGRPHARPVRLHVRQSIEVPPGTVPPREVIRCWIPFPREIPQRQDNIRIVATRPARYVLADTSQQQRTIYFESVSSATDTVRFWVEYEYTVSGTYVPVQPENVRPPDVTPALEPYLREQPPHIVFTPELRQISDRVVGKETNPLLIARRLFAWVDTSVTWATAREYSTVRNLSMYPVLHRHGDCGMQTMLFITLCRLNGIPARWQSGWEFRPPDDSMHDWGMIYFEPYGWVPMDVTYGMRNTDDESLRWFYVSGMDSYRLIFNDDYGTEFYPAKIHTRSETVDSQRGEVEWRGGNLYFNEWDWSHTWSVVEQR
jgi:transglutaminase-like putative cysteine protease